MEDFWTPHSALRFRRADEASLRKCVPTRREKVEYSEIKFFKAITKCLEVSDEVIIENFPEMEMFLGDDIEEDNVLDSLVGKYFNSVELPKFSAIKSDIIDNE